MLVRTLTAGTFTAALAVLSFGPAQARDQIQIAGSSTVLPFANIAAEQFGKAFAGKFKTPIVESGGSSAGLKNFCGGVGEKTIDIANSSRKIKPSEIEECKKNGVAEIQEIKIGYDGIVFASSVKTGHFALEPKHVYLAVAAQVPVKGALAANPYKNWKEIDPKLPDQPIQIFIPGEKHGTREVFEEKVLEAGCHDFPEIKAIADAKARANACKAVRKDGLSVDIDGDYTETLARIQRTPTAVGVFGLSFYEQNKDKIQVATVSGIVPTVESIADGKYPVSRPLYFYVKKAHLSVIPGLKEYVEFFLSDKVVGDEGMATDKGLIPMPATERTSVRAAFSKGALVN
ncbi:phosphonate ABC transporter substrate-binding protein [Vineibacter terrae]|uniref:Phosphonate ABC transporter substrate-binding protein n=1 Tax=Vineibacter terrae TaxID=2586908 RepID=A0A5C8PEY2_9HYPH|nr:substrate-binding domain-containing protein [Vineibacter terrae]TXL72329.1 phosphonate ABC transporter substrate-binding protein [Vineibacter terrae]